MAAWLRRALSLLVGVVWITAAVPGAWAHGVDHSVSNGPPVRVTFTYHDGTPVADCDFEIFDPDVGDPVETGLTDSQGRVEFQPDRIGRWQVRVWTKDGHGGTAQVMVDDQMAAETTANPSPNQTGRVLLGIVIIFVVFGALTLFIKRK